MTKESSIQLLKLSVGQWNTNCYLLVSDGESIIVDPAGDADKILAAVKNTRVKFILLTHGHGDHVQALDKVRQTTGAPLGIHPADAAEFTIKGDFDLNDGNLIKVGSGELTVIHTPGHTPGSVCFRFDQQAVVGDTFFPGGPGASRSPQALAEILSNLQAKVFTWPDEIAFHPGHGDGSTIGEVRPAFEAFMAKPRPADLHGDVEWA